MAFIQTIGGIEYPETDGRPMGETDLHIDWMIRLRDILRYRYRGQKVYVAGNLLLYYVAGQPRKFVVPDNFVVFGCEPHRRRTFKTWEERAIPNVVWEITSRSTRREDEIHKPAIYSKLGVREYFLYDPEGEYLEPALQGFRLVSGDYQHIEPSATGRTESEQLDLTLHLDCGQLVLCDRETGLEQTTEAAAMAVARQAEATARQEEMIAREAAESRAASLQAEVERLRRQLSKNSGGE